AVRGPTLAPGKLRVLNGGIPADRGAEHGTMQAHTIATYPRSGKPMLYGSRIVCAVAAVVLAAPLIFAAVAHAQDSQSEPDWTNDAPGRVHRIDIDSLPEPFSTQSNVNFPRVVPRPDDAQLQVPAGFAVD